MCLNDREGRTAVVRMDVAPCCTLGSVPDRHNKCSLANKPLLLAEHRSLDQSILVKRVNATTLSVAWTPGD